MPATGHFEVLIPGSDRGGQVARLDRSVRFGHRYGVVAGFGNTPVLRSPGVAAHRHLDMAKVRRRKQDMVERDRVSPERPQGERCRADYGRRAVRRPEDDRSSAPAQAERMIFTPVLQR